MNASSAVIHVVDDDESFRTAVSRMLRAAGYAVRTYSSAGDFLVEPPVAGPGCILLDIQMPGPTGLELQAALATGEDPLPVIFLTGRGDVAGSVRAMKAGAVDFLVKPAKRETLLPAIRSALSGDEERRAARAELRSLLARYAALSPRDREILRHIVAGRLNKQIAAALGVSERTVKAHRARIMEAMQASSVADLVRAAERLSPRVALSEAPRPSH